MTDDPVSALPDLTEGPTARFTLAIEYLVDAWAEATVDGIPAHELAQATLLTALTAMVRLHGENLTAELLEDLPGRIRDGEFKLERLVQ
jgi:hypothetical protein